MREGEQSRNKEEPARTVKEEEAQMTPAVAPRFQVGGAGAAVGRKRGRNLGDAEFGKRGFHNHLAGELHASGAQAEREAWSRGERRGDRSESRAPGMAKKEAADEAEHRVAEVAVQWGHGAGFDRAGKAVAHDKVVAGLELWQKTGQMLEVVACVRVGHQDIFAARRLDAGHQRRAIASDRHVESPGLQGLRAMACEPSVEPLSATSTSPFHVVRGKRGHSLIDAEGNCLRLIEAGHQDRQRQVVHWLDGTKA